MNDSKNEELTDSLVTLAIFFFMLAYFDRIHCWAIYMPTPGIIFFANKILFCVELSDILDFANKHIRRAEDISLFPLPPHLSPASSIFRSIESFVPTCYCQKNLVLSLYTNQCSCNNQSFSGIMLTGPIAATSWCFSWFLQ